MTNGDYLNLNPYSSNRPSIDGEISNMEKLNLKGHGSSFQGISKVIEDGCDGTGTT